MPRGATAAKILDHDYSSTSIWQSGATSELSVWADCCTMRSAVPAWVLPSLPGAGVVGERMARSPGPHPGGSGPLCCPRGSVLAWTVSVVGVDESGPISPSRGFFSHLMTATPRFRRMRRTIRVAPLLRPFPSSAAPGSEEEAMPTAPVTPTTLLTRVRDRAPTAVVCPDHVVGPCVSRPNSTTPLFRNGGRGRSTVRQLGFHTAPSRSEPIRTARRRSARRTHRGLSPPTVDSTLYRGKLCYVTADRNFLLEWG